MSPSGLPSSPSRRFSARTQLNHRLQISPDRSLDPNRRFIRALKGRLGYCTRPEGRGEPFRARVFAEPAPFAALRAGFQRTDHSCRKSALPCSKNDLALPAHS